MYVVILFKYRVKNVWEYLIFGVIVGADSSSYYNSPPGNLPLNKKQRP